MAVKFKIRCKKCGGFFLPYKSAQSRFGICKECRLDTGKCRALTETGYQCNEKTEVMGYCMWHFLHEPMKELVKEVKETMKIMKILLVVLIIALIVFIAMFREYLSLWEWFVFLLPAWFIVIYLIVKKIKNRMKQ